MPKATSWLKARVTRPGATYSEEKDQIVLRGDGYSPAEVFQDQPGGGQRHETAANELTYWPTLQMVRELTGIKAGAATCPNHRNRTAVRPRLDPIWGYSAANKTSDRRSCPASRPTFRRPGSLRVLA